MGVAQPFGFRPHGSERAASHFNDRLLLGLKGTMSEAELHVLRARLLGGQLNKARRGELWMRPPIGKLYLEVFAPPRSAAPAKGRRLPLEAPR